MPNRNEKTGIAFGVVSMNSLQSWVFDEFFYHGRNVSYESAMEEFDAENPDATEPVMRVEAVTKGLPLEPTKAAAFQKFVSKALGSKNEVEFRTQVMQQLHYDMKADPVMRKALFQRSLSLWNRRGTMQKSEGERGGHVVGHTSSGKPIYERHSDPTVIEYAKQHLFQGKSIAAAAKATAAKLHGGENMMIGPGVSHIDAKKLEHALTGALHAHASPNGEHMANEWMTKTHFNLSDKDIAKVAAHKPEGLEKAEARGGSYHRRVTDPETGKHRYYYSEDDYAKRPDAHVSGADAKKAQAKKAVLTHVGDDGASVDSLKALSGKFDEGMLADIVRGCVDAGELKHENGKLTKCGLPMAKAAPPVMISPEMKKQAAKDKRAALDAAGIKTPVQQAHEAAKQDDEVEKAEGARGGHVIGHTSSGKPIYANANHPAHASFSEHDHREAASQKMHAKIVDGQRNTDHVDLASANQHLDAANTIRSKRENADPGTNPWTGEKRYRSPWTGEVIKGGIPDHQDLGAWLRVQNPDATETERQRYIDRLEIDEPEYQLETDGMRLGISWLGGAQIVFVMESPYTAEVRECSICVPGAGNLDSPCEGGMVAYTLPEEWFARDE